MSGINKFIGIGRLGADPETFTFENGNKKTSFSLAVSESYKDKDGNKVDQVEWLNIVCWGKLAEISEQYLKKGSQVYIEGKIKTRSWDDKDGNKKYITEINAYSMQMLSKQELSQSTEQKPVQAEEIANPTEDDDLPF